MKLRDHHQQCIVVHYLKDVLRRHSISEVWDQHTLKKYFLITLLIVINLLNLIAEALLMTTSWFLCWFIKSPSKIFLFVSFSFLLSTVCLDTKRQPIFSCVDRLKDFRVRKKRTSSLLHTFFFKLKINILLLLGTS